MTNSNKIHLISKFWKFIKKIDNTRSLNNNFLTFHLLLNGRKIVEKKKNFLISET